MGLKEFAELSDLQKSQRWLDKTLMALPIDDRSIEKDTTVVAVSTKCVSAAGFVVAGSSWRPSGG
jgi:hypothetical protein